MSTNPQDHSLEVDKYINDYKLLEIRCSVLEEERTDFAKQVLNSKNKQKALEKTLSQMTIEKEDCLARLKKVQ